MYIFLYTYIVYIYIYILRWGLELAIPALSLKMTSRLEAPIAYVHLWQRSSKSTWMRLASLRHCTRSSRSFRQNSKQKPRHCPTFTTPHHIVHSSGLEFIFPMPSGIVYKHCVHMIELYVWISGCGIGLSRKLGGAWNWPSPTSMDYIYIYIAVGLGSGHHQLQWILYI